MSNIPGRTRAEAQRDIAVLALQEIADICGTRNVAHSMRDIADAALAQITEIGKGQPPWDGAPKSGHR